MIQPFDIGKFDLRLTIQTGTLSESGGEASYTYANTYTDVKAREIRPQGLYGSEKVEHGQKVALDKKAFMIRKFDRTINVEMRIVYDSQNYYVTNIHNADFDRRLLVVECEKRDND